MRKVAQIAFSGLSGASDVCAALAIAGQKAGVQQTIAFWGTEPVVEARVKRCTDVGITVASFPKKRGLDSAGQRAIQDWAVANRDADAFILHYPAAHFAVRKALRSVAKRPPVIAIEHHPNLLKRPHEWMLSALLLWQGDGVVYLTDVYRDDMAKKLGPIFNLRRRRTTVIGNGIELERYQTPGLPRTDDAFVIGMSGRMTSVKDYATLLRAFAKLQSRSVSPLTGGEGAGASNSYHASASSPGLSGQTASLSHFAQPLRLEFAGDGENRASLEALAASLGIADKVTFLGLMPFQDLLPRMRSWDAFVLSTHGETQPLALMEAMACGLPSIGTAVAGVVDVVRDGQNGLLVAENDPDSLATALARLVNEPETRSRLAAAGLESARTSFSSDRMWVDFEKFIGQLGK